ncbi:hypothetical protein GIB67_035292 [Kingdonia uniflora]|uniref:C3H1-type domain-containing protein n=1 Tax=Kingdonia uniflora TaxID=39325 RepID=A0A7J7KXX9_9MAGN|nr:hypothetical protein GIB67_035292 [Kingdonia uniflora]
MIPQKSVRIYRRYDNIQAPQVTIAEALPERPGEPDCPYFLKTQKCKFGSRCKFNHPKNTTDSTSAYETVDVSVLPERPSEPPCTFYVKTGKCKFGVTCKFNHPKDIQIPSSGPENGNGEQTDSALKDNGTATGDVVDVQPFHPFAPALLHNSKGLPIRPGEVDCPFYIRTGSCKYGATCRYNHPDRYAINPPVAATLGHPIMNSPAASMNMGVMNPAAAVLPAIDPRLAQTSLGLGSTIYPQRPGQMECDVRIPVLSFLALTAIYYITELSYEIFYMKTGECKFGERCKFHHPFDRSAPAPSIATPAIQQSVKLTLAGLPRREGAIICAYYMKTGACKYGIQCRFDHPPPGEAIAMATTLGISTASGGEVGGDKGAKTNDEEE